MQLALVAHILFLLDVGSVSIYSLRIASPLLAATLI